MKISITVPILFIFTMAIITVSCGDDGPTGSEETYLSGTVLDKVTQQPVSGAEVLFGEQSTVSDAEGNYRLSNIQAVKHSLKAVKTDYVVFSESFTPVSGENIYNIELETHEVYCNRVTSIVFRGRTYNTVLSANMCWFKENLNVGTKIRLTEDQTNNTVVEKYCLYNRDDYCDRWGGIYTWDEAMNYIPTHTNQGLCPNGWHIPTLAEFHVLGASVNEDGNALKAEGEGDPENSPQGVGTNESGWYGLLGGTTFQDDAQTGPIVFAGPGFARWWSSDEVDDTRASNLGLYDADNNIFYEGKPKTWAFSIRCLKD